MKKLRFLLIIGICVIFPAFSTPQTEEIDYLLFLPNSSDQFADKEQANLQLDAIAIYLKNRNLTDAQVFVYGYAAFSATAAHIDSVTLSRERALFVINELVTRGVPANLFSSPVASGEVNTWGNNLDEETRSPNRRVRIMTESDRSEPLVISAEENITPGNIEPSEPNKENSSRFSWIWLSPLLLIPFIFVLNRKKVKTEGIPKSTINEKIPDNPVLAAASIMITKNVDKDLEDEIRIRAYELYLQRNGQSENEIEDWHNAVEQICTKYEANGFRTCIKNCRWQADKTVMKPPGSPRQEREVNAEEV